MTNDGNRTNIPAIHMIRVTQVRTFTYNIIRRHDAYNQMYIRHAVVVRLSVVWVGHRFTVDQ